MRLCPKCKVAFQAVKKTFAEIDVCPQCAGVFLDPGEGVAVHGADGEASFLVRDGRAKIVRASMLQCPSTTHPATTMQIYAVGSGERAVEIDYCPTCTGFFLDAGEGAAIDALEQSEITTASGARFSAPPLADAEQQNQSRAVDEKLAEGGGRGLFETFVGDLFRAASTVGTARRHPRRNRWLP